MAEVIVADGQLVVEMHGVDKLWALRSRMEIPLAHVAGARVDPEAVRATRWTGLKAAGARVPGLITAGTFRQEGEWVFWDVHDPDRSIVIELHDERFARLVVEVDDPAGTAAAVASALDGSGAPSAAT